MAKLPFFRTLGNTLKNTFKELYQQMGFSFLMSFIWFLVYSPVIIFGGTMVQYLFKTKTAQPGDFYLMMVWFCFATGVWSSFLAGPVTSSLYMLYQAKKEEYPSIKMFFDFFKKIYWRSAAVHGVFFSCVTVLVFNLMISHVNNSILLLLSGIISFYFLLYILMMSFYFHPLIQLDNSFKKVVRKSFLLVLDNFGLSFIYTFILEFLLLISLLIPPIAVLLLFFYGAFQIYLISHGFEVIYDKY